MENFEYYRIIKKDYLPVNNGTISVTIPWDIIDFVSASVLGELCRIGIVRKEIK